MTIRLPVGTVKNPVRGDLSHIEVSCTTTDLTYS